VDFAIPTGPATYRLVYEEDATPAFPISTHSTTAWTFRSTAPPGATGAPVALLSLDYALAGGTATFTVRQAHGAPAQRITGLDAWTSTDGGRTWTPLVTSRAGSDRFTAQLPGQRFSLRVKASGSAGSEIDQTVFDAYG
jgi:hypothetical protein